MNKELYLENAEKIVPVKQMEKAERYGVKDLTYADLYLHPPALPSQ